MLESLRYTGSAPERGVLRTTREVLSMLVALGKAAIYCTNCTLFSQLYSIILYRIYSGFFSSVLKFVLLLLRTNIFPHDQRACVGVWCMCARKRRILNRRKSIFFVQNENLTERKKPLYGISQKTVINLRCMIPFNSRLFKTKLNENSKYLSRDDTELWSDILPFCRCHYRHDLYQEPLLPHRIALNSKNVDSLQILSPFNSNKLGTWST